MGNPIVHWEIMAPDGDKLGAFYNDIFDWEAATTPGFESYYLVDAEKTGVGGAVGQGPEGMPNYVAIYVEVPDIDAHLAKIEGAGGSTVMPRTEIPGVVTFALFADPAGNTVGLVEPEMPPA
jgi:uncharacterized protein